MTSPNDLIRRGDAAEIGSAYGWDADMFRNALNAIPAAPEVSALVEAAKCLLNAYDQWSNQVSGTPEDTIAAASLFSRSINLRAAIAAWEASHDR